MAEIIEEPSALSKIIPVSFKINDTDSVATTRLATKKQFNTTDTDAWLSFTLDGIDANMTGEFDITMVNVDENPSSIINRTNLPFSAIPFHYKIDASADVEKNQIRHAGRWIGQVIIRLANGDTTTRQFDFAIVGHLLDGKEARLILIEDYNALMATITTSKDELAQYNIDYAALIETVTTQEAARVQAELTRAQTFDALVESEMIAQNVATKLTEKEATFAPRILSVEQQLEQTDARIDTVIALPEGATTNDARLEDITVGYDGTVYASPGTAVRSQFDKAVMGVKTVSAIDDPLIDMNNVPNNAIVRYTIGSYLHGPLKAMLGGTLITYAYNNSTIDGGRVQTFYGNDNSSYSRMYWAGAWTDWSVYAPFPSIGTVTDNAHKYYDANNIDFNGAIRYGNAGTNLPAGASLMGTLFCVRGDGTTNQGKMQYYITNANTVYHRLYWGSWLPWSKELDSASYETDKTQNLLVAKRRIIDTTVFDDFNKIPPNTIYLVTATNLLNSPVVGAIGSLVTLNEVGGTAEINGITQTFTTSLGIVYQRIRWANTWTPWSKLSNEPIVPPTTTTETGDTFELSMFKTIGVVGDSYASGNFGENIGDISGVDHPEFSWPQMLARKSGVAATNYTKGGLSTRTWLVDAQGLPKLLADTPKNIYILALIRNDYNIAISTPAYIGTAADMTTKVDSFYGNYAKIIEDIQTHAPNAKLVMMTGDYTSGNTSGTAFNAAVEAIAANYGLPCMVQLDHPFFISDQYRTGWPDGGHPGLIQYNGMTNAISNMFSRVVTDNMAYFKYFKE